jgi:myosin heavy subunit
MLVPSSSRTSDIRDVANHILTKSLGPGSSHDLDRDGTTILFRAGALAFLENLRTSRLNACAIMIQKNLKAKYYRRRYLEARNAMLLVQSIAQGYLARKHAQEARKVRAATTIQRGWRGHKQRHSFNAIRNSVVLAQAAAKGFLRRGEIVDALVRSAVVLIQRVWRSRRQMKSWRQYQRKVVIIQSLWRGKRTRRLLSPERKPSAAVSPADERDDGWTLSPAWRSSLERIESIEGHEYAQDFCHRIRFPNFTIQLRPEQDAVEQSGGPQTIPAPDRLLKQLKFRIQDVDEKGKSIDKSVKPAKVVLQVLKRVHLVELTAKFEAEKAMPKKKGQRSVRDKYTDLLFPETIKYKRKKASKGKKGEEVSEEQRKQEKESEKERKKKRNQAKRTLDYWTKGLGEPLWRMTERFGYGILLRLPADVTESR